MHLVAQPHGAGRQVLLNVQFSGPRFTAILPAIPKSIVVEPIFSVALLENTVSTKAPSKFILKIRHTQAP
jgi:hypothetical protein